MSENNKSNTANTPEIILPEPKLFVMSASPHVQDKDSISSIMLKVLICLIPPVIASILFFRMDAVRVILCTTGFCMLFEWLCCLLSRKASTLRDLSATITGVLLALSLPPSVPWWLCMIGAFIAIVIAKAIYGGLGQNPFNPAAVARVALLIGFAGPMTTWTAPKLPEIFSKEKTEIVQSADFTSGATKQVWENPDFITGATPLTQAKATHKEEKMQRLQTDDLLTKCFTGYTKGSLGETSALAILIGGIALILLRIISWHIPVSMLGTVLVFTWIVHKTDPSLTPGPIFHVCTGGMMLAAFFMATDMVTSPTTRRAKMIYGACIGLISCVIRIWGGYPEGVSFALLIMNALVPLLDKFCYKRPFGWHPSNAAAFTVRRGEVK